MALGVAAGEGRTALWLAGRRTPDVLWDVDLLASTADDLASHRLQQIRRESPGGSAIDTLLWAARN